MSLKKSGRGIREGLEGEKRGKGNKGETYYLKNKIKDSKGTEKWTERVIKA